MAEFGLFFSSLDFTVTLDMSLLRLRVMFENCHRPQGPTDITRSAVLTRQRFVWKSVQPHLLPHFLELGELAPAFNRSHRIKTLSVSVFRLTNFLGEKMHSAFVTISLSAKDWPSRWREIKIHSESSIDGKTYIYFFINY